MKNNVKKIVVAICLLTMLISMPLVGCVSNKEKETEWQYVSGITVETIGHTNNSVGRYIFGVNSPDTKSRAMYRYIGDKLHIKHTEYGVANSGGRDNIYDDFYFYINNIVYIQICPVVEKT